MTTPAAAATDDAAALARALGYPYAPAVEEAPDDAPLALPTGCRLVLAFGANAQRDVLRRKLGSHAGEVLVLRATVRGVDAVYSAHVSPYGAIPATLHPSPHTELAARVLVVPARALDLLDATEPNYTRGRLDAAAVIVPGLAGAPVDAYVSRHGALLLDGGPRAVAEIGAHARNVAELRQREVQATVRDRLAPGTDLATFVLAGIRDPARRALRTDAMRALR